MVAHAAYHDQANRRQLPEIHLRVPPFEVPMRFASRLLHGPTRLERHHEAPRYHRLLNAQLSVSTGPSPSCLSSTNNDLFLPSRKSSSSNETCMGKGKLDPSPELLLLQLFRFSMVAQILQNFPPSTLALPGSAFHKALELDRAMFAREVNGPLAHSLVAAEVGILPDAPARVTAQKIGVAGGVAQRRPAGIVGADTREDTLQLLQAVLGIALDVGGVISSGIGRRWRISGSSMSARIIDEQTT